jgi:N utilization substance protein B
LSGDLDGVPMDDIDPEFFAVIVTGVGQHRSELDRRIAGALTPDWPLERLDTVLRAILRAASYELLHCSETPAKVIISEYMALADSFFSGREPALVNGVLDTIAHTTGAGGASMAPP